MTDIVTGHLDPTRATLRSPMARGSVSGRIAPGFAPHQDDPKGIGHRTSAVMDSRILPLDDPQNRR